MLVGATIAQRRRSGIHRVTLETARALAGAADLDLVRYDPLEGRLRFVDAFELDQLFGPGAWPQGVRLNPHARRVGRPFREQIERPDQAWLIVPEVATCEADSAEILSRVITSCREIGVRTAAIFYDLIPIRNAAYASHAALHEAYVHELLRCDLIVPISRHSAEDLAALWRERGVAPTPPMTPVLLPDAGFSLRSTAGEHDPSGATPSIALVGTVEPRKRQVAFLQAMAAARACSPEAARRDVVVIGSLHPDVAEAFNALRVRHRWIRYLDYVDDAIVEHAFRAADFTAFASDDEGYGLPISESLALGTPCLCADFGSMAEIAAGGGCLAVDVRDASALEAAIVRLCEEPALRQRLRAEIAVRPFQSWADYAGALLQALAAVPRPGLDASVEVARQEGGAAELLRDETFEASARADVLVFEEPSIRQAFLAEAARRCWPELLPPRQPVGDLDTRAEVDDLRRARSERTRIAEVERAYAMSRAAIPKAVAVRPVFLRLLISTFNRRDFVSANVRWLLKEIIGPAAGEVDLVVVDGGSTDGTLRALRDIADPRVRIVSSPVNVGMLGGWREASHLMGAEYVWVIGDDDFIRPEGLRAILAGLRAHPGVPFAFTNLSVYHRAALRAGDRPADLIAESRPVAEPTAADGLMSVRQAGEQTDNLFTAIYTIVWRADIWAAAYDHAFDQPAFSDLVEAIPCTDLILRRFAECDAFWRGDPAIAGNAHNSWSHWRPRWHGVVMPMAFALAREAGMDRVKLQAWADLHLKLFREALEIARERKVDPGLEPAQLALAHILFRTDVAPEIVA